MGWSSGSYLMNNLIDILEPSIPDKKDRQGVYEQIILCLMDFDWDSPEESLGRDKAYDKAFAFVEQEYMNNEG